MKVYLQVSLGGANVYAALKVAREIGEDKSVVTVIPDGIFKYVNVVYKYMKQLRI